MREASLMRPYSCCIVYASKHHANTPTFSGINDTFTSTHERVAKTAEQPHRQGSCAAPTAKHAACFRSPARKGN